MDVKILNDLRQRVLAGEDFTLPEKKAELRAAVQSLISERAAAQEKPAKATKSSKAINLDDLLGGSS